jgi:DNA-binding CsgD family transcriptional regulator
MAEAAHNIFQARSEAAPLGAFQQSDHDEVAPRGTARQIAALAFVDELYASAIEPQRLASALTSFARAFDAAEAWLVMHDGAMDLSIVERSHGVSGRRTNEQSLAHRLAKVFSAWPGKHPADIRAGLLESDAAIRASGGHYLTVTCDVPGQAACSLILLRTAPFNEAERETVANLSPDIRRALQLRGHAKRRESVGDGLRMFENTPIALLVARHRGVERSNGAAAALLATGRPIALVGGKLRFDDTRAQSAFELISRADAHGQCPQNFAFVVEGAAGRTWIAQLSLARQTQETAAQPPAVVVALSPFNGASETREAMLDGFTELTPTERSIFASVVDGEDVASIAAKMNRSIETVRWHIRNLFTKLGVNSQADLARLGALLLPI